MIKGFKLIFILDKYQLFFMGNFLFENAVNKILLEYGGVSDEIIEMADEIFNLILSQHRNYSWKESDLDNCGYKKSFILNLNGTKSNQLVKEVNVKLFAFDPRKISYAKIYQDLLENGFINIAYSPSAKRIILRIPWPITDQFTDDEKISIISSINHELKHALQDNKRGHTSITNAYTNSLRYQMNDNDKNNVWLMKYYIKKCYYLFDIDEIDARLQETYIELNNKGNLNNCEVYQEIKNAKKWYKYLFKIFYPKTKFEDEYYSKDRESFQSILTEVLGEGITAKQFFIYCQKGIKRYDEHLRRILGRYNIENNISNGSFKQYSNSEIPMGNIFQIKKETPTLWKKLSNLLNKRRK